MSLKPNDRIEKRQGEIEPRGFDWTYYLASLASGETVATSVWTVNGPDQALSTSAPTIVSGSLKTQVTLTGGSLDAIYELVNTIVTSSGYTGVRKLYVQIIKN